MTQRIGTNEAPRLERVEANLENNRPCCGGFWDAVYSFFWGSQPAQENRQTFPKITKIESPLENLKKRTHDEETDEAAPVVKRIKQKEPFSKKSDIKKLSKELPLIFSDKPIGLSNDENLCYLNASIQSLLSLQTVQQKFLNFTPSEGKIGEVLNGFKDIYEHYIDPKITKTERLNTVKRFRKILYNSKLIHFFNGENRQQNGPDILCELLTMMDVNGIVRKGRRPIRTVVLKDTNPSLFKAIEKKVTEYSLVEWPPILAVQIDKVEGVNQFLNFNPNEDLTFKSQEGLRTYRPKAAIVHHGSEKNGHYIAYVRREQSVEKKGEDWYECNDAEVKKLSLQQLSDKINEASILLLESHPTLASS